MFQVSKSALGQGEGVFQSSSIGDRSGNGATVLLHSVLDDGKPQSGSAQFTTASLVDTVETLKDAFQVLGIYALPIVAKGKFPVFIVIVDIDFNGGAVAGIINGIVEQIAEHAI